MRVLIVCSGNYNEPEQNFSTSQAFVSDQIKILEKIYGVDFDIFLIKGRGIRGYIVNRKLLCKKIKKEDYDLVHAHYGLSGLLSVVSTKLPVVVTFHGSDVNNFATRIICQMVSLIAGHSIFVSAKLRKKIWFRLPKTSVIPCGVNLKIFFPEDKIKCRQELKLSHEKKFILFPSDFSNPVKNFPLAKKVVGFLKTDVEIIELKGRTRHEVRVILNAVDGLLLTSFSEGSPQVVKEAMACNCPIVSVDVGDVREIIGSTEQCFITNHDSVMIAECLEKIINDGRRSNGRSMIYAYDNKLIAEKVHNVYNSLLKA